jgi:hypothetical protein
MSEHWPEFGSDQPNVEPEATGSSSANGAHPEEAVAVAEGAAEDPVAAESGTADGSPAVAEHTGESAISESAISESADDAAATSHETETADVAMASDAGSDHGAPVAATADDLPAVEATADDGVAAAAAADEGSAAQASADEGPELLVELARVMQETVARQRVRIVEDAERRRLAHIEQVRAREASEADRMRELAAEDMKAIEAWADGERQRIQLERHRRATELHEDLDLSLAEHRAKIEREIEGVDKAIAAYRAEVDAFFEGLDRETDVVQIAQHAAWRPVFPTLDAIAEPVAVPATETPKAETSTTDVPPPGSDDNGASGTAAGAGTSEPTVVGVMDPAAPAEPAESWTATPEASPEPVPVEASGDSDQGGEAHEPAEPVAATAGASHSAVSSLFESVQVLRPMAWLRREANGGDRPNQ